MTDDITTAEMEDKLAEVAEAVPEDEEPSGADAASIAAANKWRRSANRALDAMNECIIDAPECHERTVAHQRLVECSTWLNLIANRLPK